MSFLASINANLIQARGLLQGLLAIGGAVQVTSKISEYDSQTWGTRDYIEVAGRTTTVVADGMSSLCSLDISSQLKRVIEIRKISDDLKNHGMTTKELDSLLGIVQSQIESLRLQQIKAQSTGILSKTAADLASGRRIFEILQDPSTKARLADLSFSLGQYATTPYALASYAFSAFLIRDACIDAIEADGGIAPPTDLNYASIPAGHHTNPVFSQYQCPITLEPIRFPVRVSNQAGRHQYYELAAIFEWVRANGTNPLTRGALQLNDIQIDRAILNQIEAEMTRLGIPLR